METISISRFKATCLSLLERIRVTGQPLLVTRRGKPIAVINPPPPSTDSTESAFGCMQDTARELGDIVEPVPGEWESLE